MKIALITGITGQDGYYLTRFLLQKITKFSEWSVEHPYAVSKQFAYQITEVYKKSFNIFAVNGILFNHESPNNRSK